MLFVNWWMGLEGMQQIFWSMAIIFSILLFILLLISLFGIDHESEPSPREHSRRLPPTDPRAVLLALTFFSWFAVLMSYQIANLQMILLISALAGLVGALLPWLFAPLLFRPPFDVKSALASTGRVLKPVPPHRNGFGKVHIHLRAAPYEMDAVTAGDELPAGAPVRVIDVIDDGVLLVEPLEPSPAPRPGAPGRGGAAHPRG